MATRAIGNSVTTLLSKAETYGVKIPKAARDALTHGVQVCERAEALAGIRSNLSGAVFNALDAGRDPLTDTAVIAAASADRISSYDMTSRVLDQARGNLAVVIQLHIDTVIDAFKPSYQAAVDQLVPAQATLTANGVTRLEQTDIVASRGLDVARANLEAREAIATMSKIRDAISGALLSAEINLMIGTMGVIHFTVETGNATLPEIRRAAAEAGTAQLHPWEALNAGYTLSLGNMEDVRERGQRAADLHERQTQAAEQAHRDRYSGRVLA